MMDIGLISLKVQTNTPEMLCYAEHCQDFNLNPDWINKHFLNKITKQKFILIGMKKLKTHSYILVINYLLMNNDSNKQVMKISMSISSFLQNCKICE